MREGPRRQELRALPAMLLLALCMPIAYASVPGLWEFVDGEGVVHIGNAAPPAERGVVWLGKTAMPRVSQSLGSVPTALVSRVPEHIRMCLESAARDQSLEPAFVMAVAAAESDFRSDAVSHRGALGLMQVMPATAARYGVLGDPAVRGGHRALDPQINAQVGTRYLAHLLQLFAGDKRLALAAYNAGEGAVLRHGKRVPPYPETQKYVDKVLQLYEAWR